MENNTTWVIAAGRSHAKIFRLTHFPKMEVVTLLENPKGGLHDRDLVSSQQGRAFDSMGMGRHAYESKTDPKLIEIEKFAKLIGDFLNKALEEGKFAHLYLVAGPSFLGLLRSHINAKVKEAIKAEVHKDMTEHTTADIEKQILAARI